MTDETVEQLELFNIDSEMMDCDPDFADTQAFCEKYEILLEDSANTILVACKFPPSLNKPDQIVACIVLASSSLDVNSKVRKRIGAKKASFANAEQTIEMTGMQIGGVTPIGLNTDIPIWVDVKVMDREKVVIGGGSRDRKILLNPTELKKLPNVEVVDIAK